VSRRNLPSPTASRGGPNAFCIVAGDLVASDGDGPGPNVQKVRIVFFFLLFPVSRSSPFAEAAALLSFQETRLFKLLSISSYVVCETPVESSHYRATRPHFKLGGSAYRQLLCLIRAEDSSLPKAASQKHFSLLFVCPPAPS